MVQALICDGSLHDLSSCPLQNNVGMTEALVDDSEYPRQDLDVYQVRHARHKIICKQLHMACFLSVFLVFLYEVLCRVMVYCQLSYTGKFKWLLFRNFEMSLVKDIQNF